MSALATVRSVPTVGPADSDGQLFCDIRDDDDDDDDNNNNTH